MSQLPVFRPEFRRLDNRNLHSPTPTTTVDATATSSPVTTIGNTNGGGPDNTGNPISKQDAALWGSVLLIVGAILAVAALMLILFMIPWSQRDTRSQ